MDAFIGGICGSKLTVIKATYRMQIFDLSAVMQFIPICLRKQYRKSKIMVMNNKGTNAILDASKKKTVYVYCVHSFCVCIVRSSPSGTVLNILTLICVTSIVALSSLVAQVSDWRRKQNMIQHKQCPLSPDSKRCYRS